MDQIGQSYARNHKFMGAMLVARGGQVLFNHGYGFADLEWQVPNSPETKFRLGSVTKQFTAACILLLEERGKLAVSDPVKKYMSDAPPSWDKITIFNLLTHTSGIPNFTGFPDYRKLEPFPATAAELVARFRDKPLDFTPGEKWSYSNSGYVLLGYLIEKISGQPYADFVRQNIFVPLDMKDSGYDSNTAVIPRRASGYQLDRLGYENAGYINMTVPFAAGGLYSTTGDLLKWEQALFGGKLMKPESLARMTTPFKDNYAFGLEVQTVGGRKVIEHGGGIEGFVTELEYYPDDQLTVAVLENVTGAVAPAELAKKLAALAHGEKVELPEERKEITLDASVLSRYTGAYQFPQQGPAMLITLENGRLVSKLGNQQPVPLFAESETMFFAKVVDAQIEFPRTAAGAKAGRMTLHQNGRDTTAERMDDAATQRVADAAAAAAKRFQEQKAAPGSEAALRKLIEGVRTGKPDFDMMSAGLAAVTRQQLPQLQSAITQLGAVQSVTFKGVGPAGPDIYQVKFENGSAEWRIWMAPDGKVDSAGFRPLP